MAAAVPTLSRPLPWLALASLLACNQAPAGKGDKSSTGAADTTAVSPTACADLVSHVCNHSGEASTTCAAMREATSLISVNACAVALEDKAELDKKLDSARKDCQVLIDKLCKDLGEDTEVCAMVRQETPEFPTERCTLMLAHYDEVVTDLKERAGGGKPLDAEKRARIAADDAPAFGPSDARVVLVEFSDFQCPFCSRAAAVSSQIKEKYGERVRFVFRQFPLSFHKNAHLAAQASLAAHAQGRFWQYHDRLFADQTALDRQSLEHTAVALGLDMAAFKKSLDDATYADRVDADFKLGEEVRVDGTPTLFLNGKKVENPTDFDALDKAIAAALAGGDEGAEGGQGAEGAEGSDAKDQAQPPG
ncbi:MAG: thioredoxin domain-containing protein [Myxococcales bacterium]|nr:thioredoxin domain-containing protein [Myxococcales bacterium]